MILQVVRHCNSCGPGGHFHWPCQEPAVLHDRECLGAIGGVSIADCYLSHSHLQKDQLQKSDGRMILAKRSPLELCCWMFLLNLELPLPIRYIRLSIYIYVHIPILGRLVTSTGINIPWNAPPNQYSNTGK